MMFRNKYSAISNLKSHLLHLASGGQDAYFFSYGANGDRANFFSHLQSFSNLTGLRPVVLSIDTPDPLVKLFPSISQNSLVIPASLISDCPIGQLPWILGDPVPGEGRIYFTGCAYYLDGQISHSWLKKNDDSFNAYFLPKMILGLPNGTIPEALDSDCVARNLSESFSIPEGVFVLVAPHSYSCPDLLPFKFWSIFIQTLLATGLNCIVNLPELEVVGEKGFVYRESEFEAIGAKVFHGGFLDLLALSQAATHIITTRSGLADLLTLMPSCSFSVVYPPCFSHITRYFRVANSLGVSPLEELAVGAEVDLERLAIEMSSRIASSIL